MFLSSKRAEFGLLSYIGDNAWNIQRDIFGIATSITIHKIIYLACCMSQSAFGCLALQMLVEISFYKFFALVFRWLMIKNEAKTALSWLISKHWFTQNIIMLCFPHFPSFLHQNLAKTCQKHGKGNFDQRLECAAPKCWLKYTTLDVTSLCWDCLS